VTSPKFICGIIDTTIWEWGVRIVKKWPLFLLSAILFLAYFSLVYFFEALMIFYIFPVLPVILFANVWLIWGGILAGVVTAGAIMVDLVFRYGFPIPYPFNGVMMMSIVAYILLGIAAGMYFQQYKEKRVLLKSLKTLYSTAKALHKARTLEETCHTLSSILTEELGFLRGLVLLNNGKFFLYAGQEKINNIAEFDCINDYGVCNRVMDTGEVFVRDHLHRTGCSAAHRDAKSQAIIPLVVNGISRGVIIIDSEEEGAFTDKEQLEILKVFADYVAIVLEKTELLEEKEQLALTDDLTGLGNKRYFNQRLADELSRYRRFGGTFALLMLDIDDFKRVNDNYGHLVGDSVLVNLAKVLFDSIRDVDSACRYGGEEFAVILPQTNVRGALKVGERIRTSFAATKHEAGLESFALTISIGGAIYPDDGLEGKEIIDVADKRLYEAKRKGKNRVVVG